MILKLRETPTTAKINEDSVQFKTPNLTQSCVIFVMLRNSEDVVLGSKNSGFLPPFGETAGPRPW